MTTPTNRLLVPITVDALCVGNKVAGDWADLSPNYTKIGQTNGLCLGVSPEAFSPPQHSPTPGMHLRWSLPAALTHGQAQKPSGKSPPTELIEFPAAPNRWLVLRWIYDGSADSSSEKPIQVNAWVVESDFYSQSIDQVQQPAVSPTQWPVFSASQPFQFVGRQLSLAEFLAGAKGDYLASPPTAIGPDDPAFAAFYPTGGSAFGFIDTGVTAVPEGGSLGYQVIGWYAAQSEDHDPLHGITDATTFEETMSALAWAWADNPINPPVPKELPNASLYHGAVVQVGWKGKDVVYPSGAPSAQPSLYVGDSSAEAFATLLTADDPDADAQLLEAFQFQLLDEFSKPDGPATVAAALFDHSFGKRGHETVWQVTRIPEGEPGYVKPGGQDTYRPFPATVTQALRAANVPQSDYDRMTASLEDLQWQLYANWYAWTYQWAEGSITEKDRDGYVSAFETKIKTAENPAAEAGTETRRGSRVTEGGHRTLEFPVAGLSSGDIGSREVLHPKRPRAVDRWRRALPVLRIKRAHAPEWRALLPHRGCKGNAMAADADQGRRGEYVEPRTHAAASFVRGPAGRYE